MEVQTRPSIRRVFLTQDNHLALFWRLLSYLLLFIVVNLLANVARVGLQQMGIPSVVCWLVFALLYISGVLGLTYVYRRFIDRRSWQGIALPLPNKRVLNLAGGLVFGILVVALVFGLEYATGWIQVIGSERSTSALTLLINSLLLSLSFGMCEEICFRGYLFQNLGEGRPIWMATLITGIIFAAFHLLSVGLGARGLSYFVFIMLLNVFLVLARLLTRSLWLAIGFHTAFDWAAINLGLGTVVLADGHLLHIERAISVVAEDVLSTFVIVLAVLLLFVWAWRNNRHVIWRARLADDGQPQPLARKQTGREDPLENKFSHEAGEAADGADQ